MAKRSKRPLTAAQRGQLVQELRKAKGMSQEELAAAVGLPRRQTVSDIERGLAYHDSLDLWVRIANELGRSVGELE